MRDHTRRAAVVALHRALALGPARRVAPPKGRLAPHTEDERALHTAREQQCPHLAAVRALGDRFVAMLHARDPNALDPWLAEAEQSELCILAGGIRGDYDAVLAALNFRWSNGPVEGHVHRIKGINRSMFGRAGFDLLHARLLRAA